MDGMSDYAGYKGLAAQLILGAGVRIGEEVEVRRGDRVYRGFLMARYEFGDPEIIVLKLANGYNIGVRVDDKTSIAKLTEARQPSASGDC